MTPKGWHINVTVKSDPFLGDPPNADVFHAAVGRAVRLWGRLEGHLDHVLLSLTLLPEAKALGTISPREMPVSMKKKAEMWRRAFRTLACLQPARHRAMLLMTDMMDSAQARVVLVHSLWHGFISLDPLTVRWSAGSTKEPAASALRTRSICRRWRGTSGTLTGSTRGCC
jgi:hypothetical protein